MRETRTICLSHLCYLNFLHFNFSIISLDSLTPQHYGSVPTQIIIGTLGFLCKEKDVDKVINANILENILRWFQKKKIRETIY